MRKILAMILHIKSPVTLLFKYSTIQYCWGLSNEILGILLAQGAEKLPVVKGWCLIKIDLTFYWVNLPMQAMCMTIFRNLNPLSPWENVMWFSCEFGNIFQLLLILQVETFNISQCGHIFNLLLKTLKNSVSKPSNSDDFLMKSPKSHVLIDFLGKSYVLVKKLNFQWF